MKPIDDAKIIEKNNILEEQLKNERKEWNDKLEKLVMSIADTKKLTEAQVYDLSYRQQCQEQLAIYKIALEKKQEQLDILARDRYREYTQQYDIKLSGTEKQAFINADMKAMRLQIKLIQVQIDYFTESVKTLDNLGFAIRNKIQIVSEQLM